MARKPTRRIKVKAGEDLSPANIERVIKYLEADGATKKVACEILGIAYNTSRLGSIIDNYIADKEREKELRARKRGKPVEHDELLSIIETYFLTASMEETARQHYRSQEIVKKVIVQNGADFRSTSSDYFKPKLIPDLAVREKFDIGELVWSARYNCFAVVRGECKGGYWIRILGNHSQNAAQPPEELGSLKHLEALGLNMKRLVTRMSTDG